MAIPRVLVCIPERRLRERVLERLHQVTPTKLTEPTTGPDAFEAATTHLPHLVILTLDLPGLDGLSLCHRLRGVPALADTPVVVVGPTGDNRKYQAFYVGATEYIGLPFDGLELALRLRNQLRHMLRERDDQAAIESGPLRLEPVTRLAVLGGRQTVLTPSEYAVLRVLVTAHGQPVSVETLLAEALQRPAGLGNPQLIHTHVKNLRRKLEMDPANPAHLVRLPAGYVFSVESDEQRT